MNNEFAEVLNELKAVLLCAAMQSKQQRCTFEMLWISKESCTVIGMVYVNNMWRIQLSVYRTNSIIQ
jgi:L-amino acid N-acyltransferase YncA